MALVVLGEVDHVGADDVELNVAVKDEQNDFVVPARERGPSAYRHPLESSSPDRRAGRQRLYQLDQPAVEPRSTQRETLIEMRPIAPPSIAVPAPWSWQDGRKCLDAQRACDWTAPGFGDT
jgi:hypothetical protein